jgi:hypothetical protein
MHLILKSIFVLVITMVVSTANSQQWLWARAPFANGTHTGKAVVAHKNGFFYSVCDVRTGNPSSFQGSPISCPSEGGTLAKHDLNGNLIWAQKTGSQQSDKVTTDAAGNVYLGGMCHTNTQFCGSNSSTVLTTTGEWDAFVAKYDANGKLLWCANWGLPNATSVIKGMETDNAGFTYAAINYGFPQSKGFLIVLKFSPQGQLVWQSKEVMNAAPRGLALDHLDNSYVAGIYSDSAVFENYPLHGEEMENFFLAKYNSAGQLVWVKQAGKGFCEPSDIVHDGKNSLYAGGLFVGPFTVGTTTLTGTSSYRMFISRFDEQGTSLWAREENVRSAEGLAADSLGCYTSGLMTTAANSIATYTYNIVSGNPQPFISRYDMNGNLSWAEMLINPQNDRNDATDISPDHKGGFLLTGQIYDQMTFGGTTLNVSGQMENQYGFVARKGYPQTVTAMNGYMTDDRDFEITPNPSSSEIKIAPGDEHVQQVAVTISDILGRTVLPKTNYTRGNNDIVIDVSQFPGGIYIVECSIQDKTNVKRIVVK